LNKDSIPVIHQPNVFGPGCMLEEWGVGLNGRLPRTLMSLMVADFAAPVAPEYCITGITDRDGSIGIQAWLQGNVLLIRPVDENQKLSSYQLKLYSSMGGLCASSSVDLLPGSTTYYDLPALTTGLYILELTAPDSPRFAQPFSIIR
jgi:hypothetical protein